MAAEISSVRKMKHDGFMTLLSSAACEWFLMFLMFLDAALSYLLVKFAQYCELETPCLLCSRFDNGFGEKKPGFYWSSLCCNHREEISSFVSCSIHGKFTDVHSMCEECLTPIAMQNKSNSKSHRLLVGKSWVDIDRSFLQNVMLKKHIRFSPDVRTCSCCNKTWRPKSNAERLLEVNPVVGFGASKANVKPPLPRAPGSSRFSRRDSLKRLREKFTGPTSHFPAERSTDTVGGAMMSHVGYTKLKISSDSESEFPFSEDDDDGGNITDYSVKSYSRSEHNLQCNKRRLCKSRADSDSEMRMHQGFQVKPFTLGQLNLRDSSQHTNFIALPSDALKVHGMRDKDKEKSYTTPSPAMTPQLLSSYDGLQPSDAADGGFFGASAETSEGSYNLSHMPVISVLSELLSLCIVPPLSNQIDAGEASQEGVTSGANHVEATASTSSDDAHLPERNDTHQIDVSIHTDENLEPSERNASEPINTCDSGANHIEAAAEASEPNDMHQIDAPTQTDKNLELSDRNASEPIDTCDSAAGTSSDDAHLPETNDTHQIDASTQTNKDLELSDGKSSEPINNSCDSGANHIEAAAGTSTNDAHYLEKDDMHQIDASTQTGESLELSERNASEPTNTSISGVNHTEAAAGTTSDDAHFSESNDIHQISASSQTDENLELSDRNDLEPINACDSGVNHIEAAAETSSVDANLSETKDMHQIDASTETDENSEPINTCDSGANHIEAAAGTSSDDGAHLSETNEMHQIEALTQTDENLELSDRKTLEPINTCDSDINEEDKPQVSTSELGSSNETSNIADHKNEEPKIDEGSSSQVVLPVSASLKKHDSTYKFPEVITLSNAEGEDIVSLLKNQIEHDRNFMSSLYKELEEERNAAAIAANEAMAMITRLQEEKAALHMEALQYLRMMEEQAEYDMEALERANDLLAEKDKELQDLEHELEYYRNCYHDNAEETSSVDNRVAPHSETSTDASSNSKADKILRPNGNCKPITSTVSNFQDDKIYSQNV